MRVSASRLRALWTMILGAVLGIAAYMLGVRSETGQRLEDTVLGSAQFETEPGGVLSWISAPTLVIALAVIGLATWWRWDFARAARVVLAAAVAIVGSQVLKVMVLDRPQLLDQVWQNSFPSGHATIVAALLAAFVWAAGPRVRGMVAVVAAGVLAGVSMQIILSGWHRPSDIVGSFSLTMLTYGAVALLWPLTEKQGGVTAVPRFSSRLLRWVMVSAAVLGAAALAIGSLRDHSELMLVSALLGCVAGAALTMFELLQVARVR